MKRERIHIGTSGWYYDHWRGAFYPEDLPKKDYLKFYFGKFRTVELNNSFYRLPAEETFKTWRGSSPEGFIFAVKASRLITHNKKLLDPERTLPLFIERARLLGEKLGPILFQLPPRFKMNPERLEHFLDSLPGGMRYAFEFRDTSWLDEAVYKLLSRFNAALCVYDLNGVMAPKKLTADFAYVRLHGPNGPYQGDYSIDTLLGWARQFSEWSRRVKDIYCYFDNDQAGYAAKNALTLKSMVEGKLESR